MSCTRSFVDSICSLLVSRVCTPLRMTFRGGRAIRLSSSAVFRTVLIQDHQTFIRNVESIRAIIRTIALAIGHDVVFLISMYAALELSTRSRTADLARISPHKSSAISTARSSHASIVHHRVNTELTQAVRLRPILGVNEDRDTHAG